jgi:hypothetical protein
MEWLTYPLRWHSSRKPSGYDFSAMTPAQIKMLFSPFLFVRKAVFASGVRAHTWFDSGTKMTTTTR